MNYEYHKTLNSTVGHAPSSLKYHAMNDEQFIDLHAHTNASDGSLTPSELVERAARNGLAAIGITDHDTIYGWDEAFAAGETFGVEIVPGVELSTSYEGGRFHLLGYYVDPQSELIQVLERIQRARAGRNDEIFDNLRELQMPLEEAEVRAFAGENAQIGRPHFAQAMIARGYVSTTQEAFDQYLADGKPAYATKAVLTPEDAVRLIHQAGGVSVWAHPTLSRGFSFDELEAKLHDWKGWGLDGIETFYGRYTPEDAAWAKAMQQKFELLESGGSDWHGASKPDLELGVVNGHQRVPYRILEAIKNHRK